MSSASCARRGFCASRLNVVRCGSTVYAPLAEPRTERRGPPGGAVTRTRRVGPVHAAVAAVSGEPGLCGVPVKAGSMRLRRACSTGQIREDGFPMNNALAFQSPLQELISVNVVRLNRGMAASGRPSPLRGRLEDKELRPVVAVLRTSFDRPVATSGRHRLP